YPAMLLWFAWVPILILWLVFWPLLIKNLRIIAKVIVASFIFGMALEVVAANTIWKWPAGCCASSRRIFSMPLEEYLFFISAPLHIATVVLVAWSVVVKRKLAKKNG